MAPLKTCRWSSSLPCEQFIVENPATGQPICTVCGSGVRELEQAILTAQMAQKKWARYAAATRATYLADFAQRLREEAEDIARLETCENGKPLQQALKGDIAACISAFEYFSNQADALAEAVCVNGGVDVSVRLEPFGVVGGIIPFNWPPIHFAAKVAPALLAGNAILIKPGEQAPLTIMRLTEIAQDVFPEDIVHVLPGGAELGAAMTAHPGIQKISFTGAPSTGRRILKALADRLTPALMELGGKNALLIFDDADQDRALVDCLEAAFFNKGEACTAGSRILVQRSIHDSFVERLAAAVKRLRTGNGMCDDTDVGPLVSRVQRQRVLSYIDIGLSEGAQISAQGALPDDEALRDGFFVPPTLFTKVTPKMRIAQEEIFGPVTCVIPFDTYDEAISIANGTEFGLVAAAYTRDADRASRAAVDLEAGIVFINNYWRGFIGTPFGGVKSSGFGREHWHGTLREFGYHKAVRIPNHTAPVAQWGSAIKAVQP